MLALLGLFMTTTVILRSLGAGAILVVIVAVVATLTLVPALVSLLGDKIDWPRRRTYDAATAAKQARYDRETIHGGFWGGLTWVVMAPPVVSVGLTSGLLIAAALPYFDLERGQGGVESLPASEVRSVYVLLIQDFPAGRLAPVEVVVDGPRGADVEGGIDRLVAAVGQDPVFGPAEATEWNAGGDLALDRIPLTVDASSLAALAAVDLLRDDLVPAAFADVPAGALVSGAPALNADFEAVVDTYISRIREHYDATHDNHASVAVGLQSTAKIITGAALIMVAVFAGFASASLVFIQQLGFGLGVAILLDATIVRSILVPSAMALLGDRNWYLPRWLEWLPDVRMEGKPVALVAPPGDHRPAGRGLPRRLTPISMSGALLLGGRGSRAGDTGG